MWNLYTVNDEWITFDGPWNDVMSQLFDLKPYAEHTLVRCTVGRSSVSPYALSCPPLRCGRRHRCPRTSSKDSVCQTSSLIDISPTVGSPFTGCQQATSVDVAAATPNSSFDGRCCVIELGARRDHSTLKDIVRVWKVISEQWKIDNWQSTEEREKQWYENVTQKNGGQNWEYTSHLLTYCISIVATQRVQCSFLFACCSECLYMFTAAEHWMPLHQPACIQYPAHH